jgi:colanic acid/amylovoran biosynthesis protein
VLVEVKGVQFANKGAGLMLHAVVDRLREMVPGVEFALTPGPNAPFHRIAAVGAWQRLRVPGAPLDVDALSYRLPMRLRRAARRYGVVTEAEVHAVLDASGFAYGEAWGDVPLVATAREIERLAHRGKPYVFLPQAFGPFGDSAATRRFGQALASAAVICARDARSHEHLSRIAGPAAGRIETYPDFTLAVPGDAHAAVRWKVDRATALVVPNAEMQGPRNPDTAARSGYAPLLEALARRLRELGYAPRVLNHEGAADAPLCDALNVAVGGDPVIEEDDPVAVKGIIGAAGVVVSSRFHGCANALSQAVPCLATAWSHKYGELFSDYGVGEYVLGSADTATALSRLDGLVAGREAVRARLEERQAELVARTGLMWTRVVAALRAARAS